jgi:hypothetical protein
MRYRLRTLLIVLALGLPTLALTAWRLLPYSRTGSYPNGIHAWEQWEQRSLSGQANRIAMIRRYPSGRKAFEFRSGVKTYWLEDGRVVTEEEWWTLNSISPMFYVPEDRPAFGH